MRRPAPSLESQLLRAAERRLKALARAEEGALAWRKRHGGPFSTAGDPDLYGLWKGQHFEIELKREGEQPTALQSLRLEEWTHAGAHTFVVHSLAELDAAIDALRQVVSG